MTISELTCQIRSSGDLLISVGTIADMGLKPGDTVHVAYISEDGKSNIYREFLLSKTGVEGIEEEECSFPIPTELLEQANIPAESDLQIACFDGLIIIGQSAGLALDELTEVLERMKKASAFADHYSYEESISSVKEQLADTIRFLQEGGESNGRMPDE